MCLKTAEVINLLILCVNFFGFIFTIIQVSENKRVNRAQLVRELYSRLYDDAEMMQVFYDIEYDEESENKNYDMSLHHSEYGRKCDKLFSYFEIICCLYYRRSLNKKDMKIFEYELFRIYNNQKVKTYLNFIKEWQKGLGYGFSYSNLEKYCENFSKPIE